MIWKVCHKTFYDYNFFFMSKLSKVHPLFSFWFLDCLLVEEIPLPPLHGLKCPMDPGHQVIAFPGSPTVFKEKLDGEKAADSGVFLVGPALQRNDVSLARSLHQLNHGD